MGVMPRNVMNNYFNSTIIAAIIGAAAGWGTSYYHLRSSIAEDRESQQIEMAAWEHRWGEFQARISEQLSLMRETNDQRAKSIQAEAERYENEQNNLTKHQAATKNEQRYQERKQWRIDFVRSAELLMHAHNNYIEADCIGGSRGSGMVDLFNPPDCSPVDASRRQRGAARIEFDRVLMMKPKFLSKRENYIVEEIVAILDPNRKASLSNGNVHE